MFRGVPDREHKALKAELAFILPQGTANRGKTQLAAVLVTDIVDYTKLTESSRRDALETRLRLEHKGVCVPCLVFPYPFGTTVVLDRPSFVELVGFRTPVQWL